MVTLFPAIAPGTTAVANMTVWSTKKNDRGRFNVYAGQTLLVCLFIIFFSSLFINVKFETSMAETRVLSCFTVPSCLLLGLFLGYRRSIYFRFSGDYHPEGLLSPEVSPSGGFLPVPRLLRTYAIALCPRLFPCFNLSGNRYLLTRPTWYVHSVIISGNQPLFIKNDKGAPFMAFDAFEVELCR